MVRHESDYESIVKQMSGAEDSFVYRQTGDINFVR